MNPIHFEDLEPHRFEDLVRQLVYDFRSWHSLEATGRKGSDRGMDIRAIAAVAGDQMSGEMANEPQQQLWLIQCKREARIGPKQLVTYARQSLSQHGNVYGFLLAAPCDFSVSAREAFRDAALSYGVTETHLWGKAELEDRLFHPTCDRLLFAYFGFSLNVRRASQRTELTRRIALKRKLVEVSSLHEGNFRPVLLRDPAAANYPFIDNFDDFKLQPRWMYYEPEGHYPVDHLSFNVRFQAGWADFDTGEWDILPQRGPYFHYAEKLFGGRSDWTSELDDPLYHTIPEDKRVNIKIMRFVHYDRILAIDDIGDAFNEGPHLFVEYNDKHGFFEPGANVQLLTRHGSRRWLDPRKQIQFFPPDSTEMAG